MASNSAKEDWCAMDQVEQDLKLSGGVQVAFRWDCLLRSCLVQSRVQGPISHPHMPTFPQPQAFPLFTLSAVRVSFVFLSGFSICLFISVCVSCPSVSFRKENSRNARENKINSTLSAEWEWAAAYNAGGECCKIAKIRSTWGIYKLERAENRNV